VSGAVPVRLGQVAPLALFLAAGCEAREPAFDRTASAIVNGTVDNGDPAVVYLSLDGAEECTGTLISPRVVLTARHCLEGVSGVDVFFGTEADGSGDWRSAIDLLMYPQRRGEDLDVGLLTLDRPGPTSPIPFFGGDLAMHIGEAVHIVGFGVTSENGMVSGTKRHGRTVLDSVDQTTMAAGATGSNTCYGDSGGPNLMLINGIENVVGVTSYGTDACGLPYDISARVDYYYSWIDSYISQHDPPLTDGGVVALPDASAPNDSGFARPDSGPPDTGAIDSGFVPVFPDAAVVDAGFVDAAAEPTDAATASDAARQPSPAPTGRTGGRDSGCGCSAAQPSDGGGASALVVLGALVIGRRRRRATDHGTNQSARALSARIGARTRRRG
jgi:MYXO-CTERM domain-containing protein